jgi:capsular polysaccharide transport system permease protein
MPDDSGFSSYAKLLKLTPVEGVPQPAATESQEGVEPSRLGPWWRRRGLVSLLVFALVPALLAGTYFWAIAPDRYESEARFILRVPARSSLGSEMADFIQKSVAVRTSEDAYIVRDYLESRDAMQLLEKTAGLRDAFRAARGDPFFGFPSLFASDTDEGLYKFYRTMMSANFDSSTGISTLKVQAFAPDEAQQLTLVLLAGAEELVNRLNERSYRDTLTFAEAEVARMKGRVVAAQALITAFRERERTIDPSQATLAALAAIAKLSQEATQTSIEISERRKSSPQNPQIAQLEMRRSSIEEEIAIARNKLAGSAQSIAPRIVEYETLMLEREFAERALVAAMSAVEAARTTMIRQQVFLERVAVPSRPDYSAYPWRLLWTAAVLMIGLMLWRLWRILTFDIAHHVAK